MDTDTGPKHMKDIHNRLDQFIVSLIILYRHRKASDFPVKGGQYGGYNLSSLLYAHRLDDGEHIKLEMWSPPGRTKPTFEEAKRQKYKTVNKGHVFGPAWTNHWFKITLHIPSSWASYERVQFEFDPTGEALIFSTDGDPIHGKGCHHLLSECR